MISILPSIVRAVLWSTAGQGTVHLRQHENNNSTAPLHHGTLPGGSPLRFCNESRGTDLYSIDQIELHPKPLYSNDVFEVHLYGTFLKNITNSATWTFWARYGNSTEHETGTMDFCGSLDSIDQPDQHRKQQCPPEKGFALVTMSALVTPMFIVPASGDYYFKFDAVTKEGERIYCLDAEIYLDYKDKNQFRSATPPPSTIRLAKAISRLLGWIYTFSWSLSFYPQPLLNIRRRSTTGLTIDYPVSNTLGFLAYLLSSTAFLFSPLVRAQYAARNPVSPLPTVRANDVAFAAHALLLSAVTWSMFSTRLWGFERSSGERVSRGLMGMAVGGAVGVGWTVGIVMVRGVDGGRDAGEWAWIDVVYAVGYLKLVVTMVKYVLQAWANYQRQSTVGWSVDQVLLDFTGGVLSIAQLVIDSSMQDDWNGIGGNPVKLVLGSISIGFDVVFMLQHYWLYRGAGKGKMDGDGIDERTSLLGREAGV